MTVPLKGQAEQFFHLNLQGLPIPRDHLGLFSMTKRTEVVGLHLAKAVQKHSC